ncbi:MAG: 50S ribosomal protein L10 [Candidatus Humimicrobiaceae bacterium]|jgi:large subunit ribosomal protein L10|nr:50S ribosomal protein L10 [Actinomycetota bacterium]MDY0027509.1 50S ribosomal protein L10 [Candidatus Humimicrobiaceae bacterium]
MAREEKINKVEELKEVFKKSRGLIFTDHSGLKAKEAVAIRDRLVESDSYLKIIKNTLAFIAAEEVFEDLDLSDILKGPTSVVISNSDIISTARVVKELSKEMEALKVKAGIFEDRLLTAEEVNRFASLPPEEVLLANLAASIKAPIVKLVNVLSAPTRNLVFVLNAIKEKKI